MRALTEINQQLEKVDGFLQEAYAENNRYDIVLFAGLMAKLVAKKASLEKLASPRCEPIQAWKNAAGINPAYENRILARDEREMFNF